MTVLGALACFAFIVIVMYAIVWWKEWDDRF